MRLGFVLQKPRQCFYQDFERELRAAVARGAGGAGERARSTSRRALTPADIVERLEAMARAGAGGGDGGARPSDGDGGGRGAARARASPVFALLSDFAAGVREGYVGLDNRKAGRTAAWMIAQAARAAGQGRGLRRQPPLPRA